VAISKTQRDRRRYLHNPPAARPPALLSCGHAAHPAISVDEGREVRRKIRDLRAGAIHYEGRRAGGFIPIAASLLK
jgi:hypothetical protein